MTRDEFWKLIDRSRRGTERTEEQAAKLRGLLEDLDPPEIIEFDRHFQECIRDAFQSEIWAAAYVINGGCSDDGFDYFLGWLVAQGRKYYEAALADPEATGQRAQPGEEAECEDIWYVAADAYEARTGKHDFGDVRKNVERKLNAKTWKADEAYDMFPKLAKKFVD